MEIVPLVVEVIIRRGEVVVLKQTGSAIDSMYWMSGSELEELIDSEYMALSGFEYSPILATPRRRV